MGLIKKLGFGCAYLGMMYGIVFGLGSLTHNKEFNKDGYHSVSKFNWKLGLTRFSRYQEGNYIEDEASKMPIFLTVKTYTDGGLYGLYDRLVDRIYITPIFQDTIILERNKDFENNKSEFLEGDKFLAETKGKFKEYFK